MPAKRTLLNYCERSTVHGLGHFAQTSNARRRVVWILLILLGLCVSVIHMWMTLKHYMHKPVSSTNLYAVVPTIFPDVTFCAHQPLPRSVQRFAAHIMYNHTKWDNFRTINEVIKNVWKKNIHDSYVQKLLFALFWSSEDTRELGHQADIMIVSCKYKETLCSYKNFTLHQNWHNWNCFTFQPLFKDRSVESDKTNFGLEVILYTNEFLLEDNAAKTDTLDPFQQKNIHAYDFLDYRKEMDPSGIRVTIHRPNTYAFTNIYGLNVGNGMSATIPFSMDNISYIDRPSKPCDGSLHSKYINYTTSFNSNHDKENKRFIMERYDVKVLKVQNVVQEACQCFTHTVPFACDHLQLCYHVEDPSNETAINNTLKKIKCHDEIIEYAHKESFEYVKKYKTPCKNSEYSYDINTAPWPNFNDSRTLINNYIINALKDKMIGGGHLMNNTKHRIIDDIVEKTSDNSNYADWKMEYRMIKNNFLKINIHAVSSFGNLYVESPSYSIWEAFAEIGGIFGLYVGITLLTVCELLELIVLIIYKQIFNRHVKALITNKNDIKVEDKRLAVPCIQLEGVNLDLTDEFDCIHDHDEHGWRNKTPLQNFIDQFQLIAEINS